MRKLNSRAFFILLGVVLFASATIFVVHRLQASNIANALLFQANQAEKLGKLDQATSFLGRYLEFVPHDLEERARLGALLTDPALATTPRARTRARFVLEQVLTRDPQRHPLRQSLCRLLLDDQLWTAAKEHLALLEKSLPASGAVALLVGEWQEGQEQIVPAVATYRRALQLAPESGESYVRLANLLRRLDRKKGSYAKEIDSLVSAALLKAPADTGVLLLAAELARDNEDHAAARAHLDKALLAQPKDGRIYQALARLENHLGQRDKAMSILRAGMKATEKEQRFELFWSLANLLLDAGDLAQARKVITEIRELHESPTALDYLEARCRMIQGRWYEASRMMERIRPNLKSVPELTIQNDLFLGTCYEQLEEPIQQLAAFKRVLDQDPFSLDARKGLAGAQWQLGQSMEAIANYERIAEQSGKAKDTAKRRVELARLLFLDALQRDTKDWSRVERAIDLAEKDQEGSVEIALLRAELAFERGQTKRAEDILAQALKQHPQRPELLASQVTMALRQGKREQAELLLGLTSFNGQDSFELRLARLEFCLDRPGDQTSADILRLADGLDKLKAEDASKLRFALVDALQQLAAYPEAERLLRQIAVEPRHAEDIRVRLLLFDLALNQGNEAAMMKAIEEIQEIEGQDGPSWRFAEAQRLLRLGRQGQAEVLEKVRNLLTAVATQRPDWHGVAMLRAEIDELQGKTEQAIANYRRALEQGTRNARATRQLVLLLLRSQRYDEADQEIRKLQTQSPLSGDLQRLAVAVSLNKQDFQKAETLARQGMASGSSDYREYLWMGQVFAARGRYSEDAEKAFRKAVTLAPKTPETWVALIRYLAATDRAEAARGEIDKARTSIAVEQADLALAQCFDALGQGDKVREHLVAALKSQPTSVPTRRIAANYFLRANLAADAEAVLRPVVDKKITASEEELAWANSFMAMTLASTGDPRRQQEALALVGVSLDGNGELIEEKVGGVEDQRSRARVLALQSRRVCRDRAITLCEGLHARQALAPEDQFLLAQLYTRQGQEEAWERKARELLKSLTRNVPDEPRYLTFYAHRLLHKNDIAGAEEIIARLEQLEKSRHVPIGTLGSIELKARALEKRGRGDEALALLVSFAGEEKAPAERLFAVAQLQSRLGNLADAIDLCLRASKTLSSEIAYGSAVAILRSHRSFDQPSPAWTEQWTRMEKVLRQAIAGEENNLGFYLQLADLLDMKGAIRDLETLCRKVLELEPDNLVTLNNLAWHLAPQAERTEEALTFINRAIAKHGPRPELLDTRAFIHLNQGQGIKALADLNESVKENATAIRYFHLTRAHQLNQNRTGALAALQQANDLGLSVHRLHPAERDLFRKMSAELKQP